MNQVLICQAMTASFLLTGASLITASGGFVSTLIFKTIPLVLGVWMAFNVFAQVKGWPI